MVTLNTFVKRWGGLKDFVVKKSQEILLRENDRLVKMQQEQHHEGKGASGKTMQTGYSSGYAKQRKKKGLQTKYVDLHFSGKYHKGLKVKPTKGGVNIESNVEYEQYIRKMFPDLAGLDGKNAKEIRTLLAKELAPQIKKYLVK